MAKKSSKQERPREPIFWTNLSRFLNYMESLEKSLISVQVMRKLDQIETKKIESFIKTKAIDVKAFADGISFLVPPRYSAEYKKLKRERDYSRNAQDILPRSLFVSGVSHFDVFIGRIFKTILDTQPNIISPEKTLSFADIKGFKTIQEAVDHLIDKEIDTLLFDSHSAHLDWLSKKTRVAIQSKLSSEIPVFIELTERRNLFVHADGVVTERYLRNCKEAGAIVANDCIKGTKLGMTPEYFRHSIECLYKVATKTSFLIWRKFKSIEIETADAYFNDFVVSLIKQKKYKLAENLLMFAEAEFVESKEEMRKVTSINLALARKLDNRKAEAIVEIDKIDWSACADDLKLGVAALKDDYDEIFRLMEKIGKESNFIRKEGYSDDPIFEGLRNHASFPKFYRKIYGEKFVPFRESELMVKNTPMKKVKVAANSLSKKSVRA